MPAKAPIGAFHETVGNSSVVMKRFLRHQVSRAYANLSRMAAIGSHLPNNSRTPNEASQLLVFAQANVKVDAIRPYIDVFFTR